MATVQGTLDVSLDEANAAIRSAAAQQGYALDEARSGREGLVFKKGITLVSWGSELSVQFEAASPSQTRLTLSTGETFGITDWGRGKRAAQKLLVGVGAHD
jgi:hypothetical protein